MGTASSNSNTKPIEFTATVEHIRFRSDDGTVIASVDTILNGSETSVVGPDGDRRLQEGVRYKFFGHIKQHPKHGQQLKFSTFVIDSQVTRRGVVLYLSKSCDGIGERFAGRLWDRYGKTAVEVLRTNPQQVISDGLLSESVAMNASDVLRRSAANAKTRIELMQLFDGRRFPGVLINECIARWGDRACAVIRANPLRLLTARPKLPGCGFERCSRMYTDFGGSVSRLQYQLVLAWNYMRNENRYGHTWFRAADVARAIEEKVDKTLARSLLALRYGLKIGWLAVKRIGSERYVTVREFAEDEERLAVEVRRLLGGRLVVASVGKCEEEEGVA